MELAGPLALVKKITPKKYRTVAKSVVPISTILPIISSTLATTAITLIVSPIAPTPTAYFVLSQVIFEALSQISPLMEILVLSSTILAVKSSIHWENFGPKL
jgi:hypothetical protein